MVRRAFAVLFMAGLLAGCTDADWDHTFSYVGLDSSKPAPPPQVTAATTPAPVDTWCVEVAKSEQVEAAEDGFDAATQQHRAQVAFEQCSRGHQQR